MPFSNPYTVTIGATPFELKRVNQDNFGAEYLHVGAGFEVSLKIRHSYEGKKIGSPQVDRHNVDLTKTVFNADGTTTVIQVYLVARSPRGTLPADMADFIGALSAVGTTEKTAIASRDLSL